MDGLAGVSAGDNSNENISSASMSESPPLSPRGSAASVDGAGGSGGGGGGGGDSAAATSGGLDSGMGGLY